MPPPGAASPSCQSVVGSPPLLVRTKYCRCAPTPVAARQNATPDGSRTSAFTPFGSRIDGVHVWRRPEHHAVGQFVAERLAAGKGLEEDVAAVVEGRLRVGDVVVQVDVIRNERVVARHQHHAARATEPDAVAVVLVVARVADALDEECVEEHLPRLIDRGDAFAEQLELRAVRARRRVAGLDDLGERARSVGDDDHPAAGDAIFPLPFTAGAPKLERGRPGEVVFGRSDDRVGAGVREGRGVQDDERRSEIRGRRITRRRRLPGMGSVSKRWDGRAGFLPAAVLKTRHHGVMWRQPST